MRGLSRFALAFLGTAVLLYAMLLVPTPYYVYMPGTVEDVGPMVKLGELKETERQGSFLMTTVMVGQSNWLSVFLAAFDPSKELRKKETVLQGRTEKEYEQRQGYVMLHSQSDAIQAAYKLANVAHRIQSQGVMILAVSQGYGAAETLKPGDKLLTLDGEKIDSSETLMDLIRARKPDETVHLSYQRRGIVEQADVKLRASSKDASVAMLGITPADMLAVRSEDPAKQVSIEAGEIGGPSAGFMFALEIYDRLQPEDWTKGYRIAGTGTITPQGDICAIGGIRQKIAAAEREGVDIFFTPTDKEPPECNLAAPVANTSDARDQAEKLDAKLQIVPVRSIVEALDYLRALPVKTAAS
jgi:Lon-like protease